MDYAYYLKALSNPAKAIRRLRFTEMKAASYYNNMVKPEYYWLDERIKPGTTLLDIGGYIGDTALYFSRNPNVKQVLSYEPVPAFFNEARRSVSENPYKSKIKLHNCGVSAKPQTRSINPDRIGMPSFATLDDKNGIEVKSVTLPSILKGLKNVAMKMDIEGEEHEIFDQNPNLDNVYAIQMEYHNGVGHIKQVLEGKRFKVWSKPEPSDPKRGYIYAIRTSRP